MAAQRRGAKAGARSAWTQTNAANTQYQIRATEGAARRPSADAPLDL
jgi:hypothetical protein